MARNTVPRDPVASRGYDGATGAAGSSSPDPPQKRRGNGGMIALLALLLIGVLIWALIATFAGGEESAGPEAGITLSELSDDPEGLYGSQVVVSGEVSDIVGGDAEAIVPGSGAATGFVLGEGDQSALVVGSGIPQLAALRAEEDIADGDVVQVSGTVREYDLAALEEDLGVDLADDAFDAFDERPVIVARGVNLVPTTARQQGEQLALTADELTDSPQEYLTQRMTVRDFTVDESADVISPRAITLSEDVLVVGASGPTNVAPGFTGTVTGTLIEASTARLLNSVSLPAGATAVNLFAELGIEEQEFAEYDYVLVADRFQPGG